MYISSVLIEAVILGIMLVVVGTVVGYVVGRLFSVKLEEVCKKWNKNHVMELSLFFTGFFVHILCELLGINKWYCKNGAACKNK